MLVALLAVAFQLGFASNDAPLQRSDAAQAADSARDLKAAHSAQTAFEFARRISLPQRYGSSGPCTVRLGRYCWWLDESEPELPPEPESITRKRGELLATLDSLGAQHPGDEWLAGMRVYYRIDGKNSASADSVARDCGATRWWCLTLVGYADHVLGESAAAESAFVAALDSMPPDEACRWRDMTVLLSGDTRSRYEKESCPERRAFEDRYWLLSRPRLGAGGNEWRTEFYVRKLQARLAQHSANPQPGSWGRDAEELLLRFGWPVAWSREQSGATMISEPNIVGHDPVPSFNFAPVEEMFDSLASAQDDAWDLRAKDAEARFAPRGVRRVSHVGMQLARFRRGDSILVVSAFSVDDDSLYEPTSTVLAVTLPDGSTRVAEASGSAGTAALMLESPPVLAGVEVEDSSTATLARSRALFRPPGRDSGLAVSDLLLFRVAHGAPESLTAALDLAVPGDTMSREKPIGIYWESYGVAEQGEALDVSVTVERIDHSWLRGVRQRLRMEDPDSPLKLRWSDARPAAPGEPLSRAITLDLGNLDAGKYRISLALTRADGTEARSAREIELTDR
jgi:hypothetical protein